MENENKFLPIGSVVILKDASKKVMITGFCMTTREDVKKMYDYSGIVYPEGIISSDQILVFNHNQIEKIFALGYSDDEDKKYREKLYDAIIKNGQQNGEA